MIYNQIILRLIKLILILLKVRESMPQAIFILILVNIEVFSKNQDLSFLSFNKKKVIIIFKFSNLELSILSSNILMLDLEVKFLTKV